MDWLSPQFWAAAVRAADFDDFIKITLFLGFLCVMGFYTGFRSLRHYRLMEDTPTAKTRSAAQGYCELVGRSLLMQGEPIIAPLTKKKCTWWAYEIEQHRSSGKRSRWVTIEEKSSDELFLLKDETGECVINPDGAIVTPALVNSWYGNTRYPESRESTGLFSRGYRYTEKRIHEYDDIYVIGFFETKRKADDFVARDEEVASLLRSWKQAQPSLLKRFDTNKDGTIDMKEWEVTRQTARAQVDEVIKKNALEPGVNVMMQPPDGRPFILSADDEAKLVTSLKQKAILGISGFFVCGAAVVFMVTAWLTTPV